MLSGLQDCLALSDLRRGKALGRTNPQVPQSCLPALLQCCTRSVAVGCWQCSCWSSCSPRGAEGATSGEHPVLPSRCPLCSQGGGLHVLEEEEQTSDPRTIPVSFDVMQKARACVSSHESSKAATFAYSKSEPALQHASFPLTAVCSEQCCSLLSPFPGEMEVGWGFKPGRAPRELQVSTALCLSLLSTLFPLRPEVLPPYVLSCPSPASPTCSSQSRGDTGPCPGTLAAVGPLGTCTPVDGVKVDFVETCSAALVLCLQPCCVHVCLLCMGGTLLVSSSVCAMCAPQPSISSLTSTSLSAISCSF